MQTAVMMAHRQRDVFNATVFLGNNIRNLKQYVLENTDCHHTLVGKIVCNLTSVVDSMTFLKRTMGINFKEPYVHFFIQDIYNVMPELYTLHWRFPYMLKSDQDQVYDLVSKIKVMLGELDA